MHPPPPPRRIIPERLWSSRRGRGDPARRTPPPSWAWRPPGAVDVSGRGLRAGRPPDSLRGPRRCIVATAAAVAQAPERDPPAGINVTFRPRRASSDPPCGGRPGQDYVLDRATTPQETSSRPRRRLRPHPRPRRRASPTSEAIRDKPTDPGTRSTTTGPPPGRRRPPSEGGGGASAMRRRRLRGGGVATYRRRSPRRGGSTYSLPRTFSSPPPWPSPGRLPHRDRVPAFVLRQAAGAVAPLRRRRRTRLRRENRARGKGGGASLSSQPRLRTPPHRCRRDRRRPPTERPHSRRAILAGAVVIVLVVVALRR